MLENGFIKLHRSLLKWEWYDDISTFKVFLHLLLTVNIEDSKWRGEKIPAGARVTSIAKLAEETKLSQQKIRTALKHLELTHELTNKKTSKYTVVTVSNWSKFQQLTRSLTKKQQTTNKQLTNNQPQYKKVKEDIKKVRSTIPTFFELSSFITESKFNVNAQKFFDYYEKNNWKTKKGIDIDNWQELLRQWHEREFNNQKPNTASGYNNIPNLAESED
jgi:predicted transcriptional regulator